jgi:hypothetical protein
MQVPNVQRLIRSSICFETEIMFYRLIASRYAGKLLIQDGQNFSNRFPSVFALSFAFLLNCFFPWEILTVAKCD